MNDGKEILWKHWVDAYTYDKNNSISTFQKLTDDHFYLNAASRMRNHLADDVRGLEMKGLIEVLHELFEILIPRGKFHSAHDIS